MSNAQLKEELHSKPLVLVVDDEESIRETLAGVLADESFVTDTACSGEEALDKVAALRPDVVFLDIWMPGSDGIETLTRIKDTAPDTEVIMISGHATIQNALEATKRGAFDFIEKPLDIDSVVHLTSRAIDKRAQVDRVPGKAPSATLSHPGMHSTGLRGRNVGQRTLRTSTVLYGQGLHGGQKSGLVLEPLPLNSGIHLAAIGGGKSVPAFVDNVDSTALATTLRAAGVSVSTVEHLMAALHAYRISNLLIKCNGEVPIFDGSSAEFMRVIEEIGIEEQGGEWYEIAVDEPISVVVSETNDGVEEIILEPSDELTVTYELNYPDPVGTQQYTYRFTGVESFRKEISLARTFGFMKDIERMQKAGLAAGGRLDNFILIGSKGILNTELRYDDELVRHKILDAIGDLFLLGRPLRAHVIARMTGHSDNVKVLRELRKRI